VAERLLTIGNENLIPPAMLDGVVRRAQSHLVNFGNPEPCWLWDAHVYRGYGHVQVRPDGKKGRNMVVKCHRLMYLIYRGRIPAGMQLDHICEIRRCANPFHLQIVTNRENSHQSFRVRTTACKNGHPHTPEHIHVRPNGRHVCRTCQNDRQRKRYVPLALRSLEVRDAR